MNTNNTHNTETDEQTVLPFEPLLPEAATRPEVETLQAENDVLRSKIRFRDGRDAITASLKEAGARSPELMFEAVKNSLQFGEDGSVQNAEAVVSEMKRRFPEQFGVFSTPPPIDGGAGAKSSVNILTKEALAAMNPADIARLDWDEVRQVLQT
jgi:hypothetical protein